MRKRGRAILRWAGTDQLFHLQSVICISVSRLLLFFEGRGIGFKKNGIGEVSAMVLEILLYRYKGSLHICTSIEKFVIVKTLVTNGLVTDTVSMATSIQTKYCQ